MRAPARCLATLLLLARCAPFAQPDDASALDAAADRAPIDASPDAPVPALPAPDAARTACEGARSAALPEALYYHLRTAPFPGTAYPDVAVHVPPGFDGARRPGMLVFFHGFDNCVTNVLGTVNTPCLPGGPAREALHLSAQLDAAHVNALLVAVEVEVDMQTGVPGALATPGNFRALLHELLTEHLDDALGCPGLDVDGIERVALSSHSGGYQAVAAVLAHGEVPQVREVDLLDSLYGNIATYDGWVHGELARFDAARAGDGLRWVDVYTSGGGTAANSRAMAARAMSWLDAAGLGASLLDDDTTDTLGAADYAHPVLFKLSALSHNDVPRYYVHQLALASGFAPLP